MKKLFALSLLSLCLRAQSPVYPGGVVTTSQLTVAANNVQTALTADITATATSFTVQSSAGIRPNMLLSIDSEILFVCSVSGTTIQVGRSVCPNQDGRGYDGTSATSHNSRSLVSAFIDAWHHNAVSDEIIAIEQTLGANLSNIPVAGPAAAHTALMGPTSGGSATPAPRLIIGSDLPASGATPNTYGDATHVGQFTIDATGRITSAINVAVTGGGGGASGPPQSLQTNQSASSVGFSNLLNDGSTFTVNPSSGPAAQKQLISPAGSVINMTNPTCDTNPAEGVQAGLCYNVQLGGNNNPANYGNMAGDDWFTIFFNGNNSTQEDKKTISGHLYNTYLLGGGQKGGVNHAVWGGGVGDSFVESMFNNYSSYNTASGDEGARIADELLIQQLTKFKPASVSTSASTCISSFVNNVTKNQATPQSFQVTAISGCNVNDYVTLGARPIANDIDMEVAQITAVGPGPCPGSNCTLTALLYNSHTAGELIRPAVTVGLTPIAPGKDTVNPPAQGKIWVDLNAPVYSAGTAAPTVATTAVVGTATSWDPGGTKVGPLTGGTVQMPGCITFARDDFNQGTYASDPLISYYPIAAIVDNSHLTLAVPYSTNIQASGSSNYKIVPCARQWGNLLDNGSPVERITGITLEYNQFPWTVGHTLENTISPYSSVQAVHQFAWWHDGPVQTPPEMLRVLNEGYQQAALAIRVLPTFNVDTATTAGFKDGIVMEGNIQNNPFAITGKSMSGSAISLQTFNTGGIADSKTIFWQRGTGSLGDGFIKADAVTGRMFLGTSSAKVQMTDDAAHASSGAIFDFSAPVNASHLSTLIVPDLGNASGTIFAPPGSAFSRTLPSNTTDVVELGYFVPSAGNGVNIDLWSCSGANYCKRYSFAARPFTNNTSNTWYTVPPISQTNSFNDTTNDFQLEAETDNTVSGIRLRYRNTVGAGGWTMFSNLISPNSPSVFTASSANYTATAPTAVWPSAVITQTTNKLLMTNATGFALTLDPTNLTANRTLTIQDATGILGTVTGSPADNDCARFSVIAGVTVITTAGAACGGSGGSPSFTSIQTGVNISATMTLGSGSTLTVTGTGVNNANQVNGAASPASAAAVATNSSRQLIAATTTGTGSTVVLNNGPTIAGHPTVEGVTSTGASGTGNLVFSIAPTLTGHPTIEGVTSTGASGTGNLVFSIAPTLTGHPTIEGVTSTGASGTGNFVFSASPAFTGTVTGSALTLTGNLTTNVTGLTQCLHVNSAGLISGTGNDCGAGSGSIGGTGTANTLPLWTASATIGNSNITQDGTTAQISTSKSVSTPASVVTFSATPVFDYALGNRLEITLTGNVTSSTFTHLKAGAKFTVVAIQDATGGRTFVWPTAVVSNSACTPALAANIVTTQYFEVASDGATVYGTGCPTTDTPTLISGPTRAAPGLNPASGNLDFWFDSTANTAQVHDPSGNLNSMVRTAGSATAHQWIDYIATNGVPHSSQPAFTDISGSASAAQIPNVPVTISTSGPVTDPGGANDYQFNNAAGALTFNLPDGVAGLQRCYRNATTKTGAITIAVTTSNSIDLNGANGTTTTGTLVSSGALGDAVCLVSDVAHHWYAFVQQGIWTNN